jgi:hypothetical protein
MKKKSNPNHVYLFIYLFILITIFILSTWVKIDLFLLTPCSTLVKALTLGMIVKIYNPIASLLELYV